MNRKVISLLLLMKAASVASCAAPKLRFTEAELERVTLSDSHWTLHFAVTNPNFIGIPISNLEYRARIDSVLIAQGDLRDGVFIRGQRASEVLVGLKLPHLAVASFVQAVDGKREVPYRSQEH
jgi:LEA14-like dessication related protein